MVAASQIASPPVPMRSEAKARTAFLTLSVVIPALNEEDGISQIVQRVHTVLPSLREVGIKDLELIVVDDGSSDRTAALASQHHGARVISHPRNLGYGAAIKTGFANASGELLAFLDADGTYPPEYLPALCQAALGGGADVAVGSRRSGSESHMPPVRRIGNVMWSSLVSLVGNRRVADPASGMRVLRRSVLTRLYPLPDGLNFTPVMSTRSAHEGLRVVEVPIPYRERLGRSKLSVVRDGSRFLKTILWTSLEYNPVRILGAMGLAAMVAAAFILLAVVALRLQGVTLLGPVGVFGIYAALVLAVAGVSVFCLGSTFNCLVSLFHRRPIAQGLFGRPLFARPLDRQFGWMGVFAALAGAAAGLSSLYLTIQSGWEVSRLWLWLVASALGVLMGVQLVVSWTLMRVLEELSQRSAHTNLDRERKAA